LGDLVSRFVSRDENGFMTAAYLYPEGGVDIDLARLEATVAAVDPSLVVTGVSMVDRELGSRFAPQLFKGLLLGAVAVAALIFCRFRRVGLTLLALAPTVVGLLWSGGALALMGVELDLFSVFGAVMVIGVGVDYGIHILHRHCLEKTGGVAQTLSWTGAAILFAGVTTMIGFGALIGSSYAPLASMGVMVTVAIVCILVTSLLVLPALLEVREWR
jgi:predicted RND superfamily exporter protein